ncbi:MAG: flippase-like domain-containing protein [Pseudomonadota bacterium]
MSYIGLLIGLIVLVLLIAWQGLAEIINVLSEGGWLLLTLPVIWLPSFIIQVYGWNYLFPVKRIPPFKELLMSLWMGRAINTLLPVATIGGEIAKARLLILWGRDGIDASASVMVDKAVQALALVPWAIIGTVLMLYLAMDNQLAMYIAFGTLVLSFNVIGFMFLQRKGMFGFSAKLVGKFTSSDKWGQITTNAHQVDDVVRSLYSNKKRFTQSIFWRTVGLVLSTAEVWLACYLLGFPISIIEAIMLKSLTQIITDIAFVIPNGYGVQEGGFILIGSLVGLSPEVGLAVSLAIRIRELVFDLPGLMLWHHIEVRYLLKKKDQIA